MFENELTTPRQQLNNQTYEECGNLLTLQQQNFNNTNMIFIKNPDIYNTDLSIDLRVQCTLSIQNHKLDLQVLIDTGASNENILMTFLPLHLIKYTNTPQINTLFDGSKQSIHKYILNAHIKFYINCGTYLVINTIVLGHIPQEGTITSHSFFF